MVRKFNDNGISNADLRKAVEKSNERYTFLPPLKLDDTGRDKVVRLDESITKGRRCFILSSGGCSSCFQSAGCESCLPRHIAVEIVHDVETNLAYAKCCTPVQVHFLFLEDWQVACLKKFPCTQSAGDDSGLECLCTHPEIAKTCGDGCNVFCATYSDTNKRWESDLRPSPVGIARTISGISPADGGTMLGCGLVIPAKIADKTDLDANGCCEAQSREFIDDDQTLDEGSFECYEYVLEKRYDECSTFCVEMNVTSATEDAIECASLTSLDSTLVSSGFETSAGAFPGEAKLCMFKQEGSLSFRVCVCIAEGVAIPSTVNFNISLTYVPVNGQCTLDGCGEATDMPDAGTIQAYNTGIYIPRNTLIPVQTMQDCKVLALAKSTLPDNDCGCASELKISPYSTVTISGVEDSVNDPTTGMPWGGDNDRAPCGCDYCEEWNRDFELVQLPQTDNGEGDCGTAIVNHCASTDSAPCGPYDKFPCAPHGDKTYIHVEYKCENELYSGPVPCGDPRLITYDSSGNPEFFWTLRVVNFNLFIRGCGGRINWGFDAVYIPKSGPICLTATTFQGQATGASPTPDIDCEKDYDVLGLCDEGLGHIIDIGYPGPEEIDILDGLSVQWDVTDPLIDPSGLLIASHDMMNCLWNMSNPPRICFHRTRD